MKFQGSPALCGAPFSAIYLITMCSLNFISVSALVLAKLRYYSLSFLLHLSGYVSWYV
jgi:hypothetical protein